MIAVIIGVWTMIALTSLMRGIVSDMLENGIATLTGDIKIYPAGYHDDPSIEFRIDDPNPVMSTIAKKIAPRILNMRPGCGSMPLHPMPGTPSV